METTIVSYCKIKKNSVWVNGRLVYEGLSTDDPGVFLSALYKAVEVNYPKFFKMDKLCKLGVLATELLICDTAVFSETPKNKIALLLSNRASSLESDRVHAKALADKENYFPSPSVFVYTLPNIVIGEIAIKHKITGENAFFVSEEFDAQLLQNYAEILLGNNSAELAICGWVNLDGPSAEAFVYCVKNTNFKQENTLSDKDFSRPHKTEQIHELYSF